MKKAIILLIAVLILDVIVLSSCITALPELNPSAFPTSASSPYIITTLSPTPTPTTIVEVSDSIGQISQSTQSITASYSWRYNNKQWTYELQIPQALYDYCKKLPRSPTENYSVYVTHPLDDTFIEQIVDKINEVAQQEGYNEFQKVSFAITFIQSLPYTSDSVSKGYDEYPRYPVETLVDNGGDCEDTSILVASLLEAMGYGVVLLVFPQTDDVEGHCAVGVNCGLDIYGTYWKYEDNKYYYLETTDTGWDIGDIPEEYKTASANIYPMIPVPILTHSWHYQGTTQLLELKVIVDNLGSAEAQGVYVHVGFDAGNDMWWNPKESPTANIQPGGSATYTLNLKPPSGEHTRLIINIMYDGYAVEKSYSNWFDT